MIYIFGTGGFARELANLIHENGAYDIFGGFIDQDYAVNKLAGQQILRRPVISVAQFSDQHEAQLVIGVGEPHTKRRIVEELPTATTFATLVHHTALVGMDVRLGPGSVVCAGCILTTNVVVGAHAHFNLATTVGHDCVIGNCFTSAPAVNISGSCEIADEVYFGTSSAIRQGLRVAKKVTIGMGAMVVKDCPEPGGTYVGTPAKLLSR